MKVEGLQPPRPLERPGVSEAPISSFEETLDLAATLRLRLSGQRALTFDERGVLALSEATKSGPEAATDPSSAITDVPAAAPVVTLARLTRDPGAETVDPTRAGGPRRPPSAAPAAPSVTSGAMSGAPIPSAMAMPGASAAASPPAELVEIAEGAAPAAARRRQGPATPAGDMTLTIAWTDDGLVVYAAGPQLGADETERLRARADELASSRGERLSKLILNGSAVAPPSLHRRP